MKERSVVRVIPAERVEVAPGFFIHRALPIRGLRGVGPFLLIDHMGPMLVAPGEAKGVPAHPHRGFEPVTYLIRGQVRHRDSLGNDVIVRDGDVDWMTAASGIIHSEMPPTEFLEKGGELHGFQIWVNLPRSKKMSAARLQYTASEAMPILESKGVWVKVLAGEHQSLGSPVEISTPLLMLHVVMKPGSSYDLTLDEKFEACLYVAEGEILVGIDSIRASEKQLIVLQTDGYTVALSNPSEKDLSFLVLAGAPIADKVFSYGPFVMNSFEEIQQAIEDYEQGKMGQLTDA